MNETRGATSANWLDAPHNRWGFLHVGELARTTPLLRGTGPVVELPLKERNFNSFNFEHRGDTVSFQRLIESTYTDGMLVLHEGEVIFEHYAQGMSPSHTHLLMSASKSLTSALCGVLIEQGSLRSFPVLLSCHGCARLGAGESRRRQFCRTLQQ